MWVIKYYKTGIALLAFALMLMFSCEQREWINPYDPATPPELWAPYDLTYEIRNDSVLIFWKADRYQVDRFIISKKIDVYGEWVDGYDEVNRLSRSWGELYVGDYPLSYSVSAKAADNFSSKRIIVIPLQKK